jgi:sugar lactone lactonase YvrE
MMTNSVQIDIFVEADNLLGEGPIWDTDRNGLWWVDIEGKTIYFADAAGQNVRHWITPERVGFVLPRADGRFWAGFQSGLHIVSLPADAKLIAERIDPADPWPQEVRLNDACSDGAGGLYACTMDIGSKEPLGHLYHYTADGQRTVLANQFVIANGPALSLDGQTIFVAESVGHRDRPRGIYALPIAEMGLPATETLLIDWRSRDTHPDGLTTDAAGNIWVGEHGGRTIRQFAADGTLLRAIDLPARNVTKIAVGPGARTLFVTSARQGMTDGQLTQDPLTGSVFRVSL